MMDDAVITKSTTLDYIVPKFSLKAFIISFISLTKYFIIFDMNTKIHKTVCGTNITWLKCKFDTCLELE